MKSLPIKSRHAFIFLCFLTCISACARGAPLSSARIAEGEQRWKDTGLADYDLHLSITGDRIEEGNFVIAVKAGRAEGIIRNGAPIETDDPFYTIPGIFRFLNDELEMAEQAARFWNAQPGAKVVQRAHFHPQWGYPTRYLRAVTGTSHGMVLVVDEMVPTS